MSYFSYSFNTHFLYPTTITTNISYKGVTGVLTTPFTGASVNTNFYNLACSSVDNTTRITAIEAMYLSSGSSSNGFVSYTGLTETQGSFYSGSPLSISAGSFLCSSSSPYVLDGTAGHKLAFRMASGSAISGSYFRTFYFGEAGIGSPFTSVTSMLTYMNNKLRYNTKDVVSSAMEFKILGTGSPGTNLTSYNTGTALTKYFYLYINDGYFTQTSYKCSIPIGTGQSYTLSSLASALQNTLNGVLPSSYSNPFTVSIVSNDLKITASTDRAAGGIYEFLLVTDPTDDGGNPSLLSGSYLGFTPSQAAALPFSGFSYTTMAEAYDATSFLNFTYTGTGPYTFVVEGVNSSLATKFLDNDASATVLGMFVTLQQAVPSASTFYHVRRPYSVVYSTPPVLNYGGDFNANNITCNDMYVAGNITYSGSVDFTGEQTLGNIVANGNLTVLGTTQNAGSFDASTILPSSSNGRVNFNGCLYANQFIGDTTGINVPSYVYNVPHSSTSAIGYTTYYDGAVVNPVSGIGTGSITISLASTPNSALFGSYDNLISKPSSNTQGQGVSYDFTIDYGTITEVFQLGFYYSTSSNYASGDIGAYIYDITKGMLLPTSVTAIAATSGSPARFIASFIPSTSTAYRLILHIRTTNASAYTLQFSGVSVAPQVASGITSSAVNQWTSYTMVIGAVTTPPTISGSTVTNNNYQYRRVGSDMELEYNFKQTAAGSNSAGSGTYLFGLPSGYTLDWTKLAASISFDNYISVGTGHVYNGTNYYPAKAYVNFNISSSAIIIQYQSTLGTNLLVGSTNLPMSTASFEYHFACKVPIAQWVTSINLANDYTEYASNNGTGGTSANTTYATGMTVGASGNLVPSVASTSTTSVYTGYKVTFSRPIQTSDIIRIELNDGTGWVDASRYPRVFQGTTVYGIYWAPITGDTSSINVFFANGGILGNGVTYGAISTTAWSTLSTWYWRVRKISNGNTAEQPPVIRSEYYSSSVVSIPTSGNPILFDTMTEDTHSCVSNPAANWKFTAPMAGVYSMEVTAGMTTGRTYSAGELWSVQLYKNGAYYTTLSSYMFTNAFTNSVNPFVLCGHKTIRLQAGDYIHAAIYYSNSSTGTTWATATVNTPRISVERIGS